MVMGGMSEIQNLPGFIIHSVLVPSLDLHIHHWIKGIIWCREIICHIKIFPDLEDNGATQAVHHLCGDIPVQRAMHHPKDASTS